MTMEKIFSIVLKAMLEPSSDGHWTTTQLYGIANRAQNRIITLNTDLLDTHWTKTSETDDQEITLATNEVEIENVYFDKRMLIETTMRKLDLASALGGIQDQWRDWSGQPTMYYMRKNVVGLVPKVSAAYAGKTIDFYGQQNMTDLASSTDVPFDNYTKFYSWSEMIIEFMLWQMKLSDGNEDWQGHRSDFYILDKSLKKYINNHPNELASIPLIRGKYITEPTKSQPLG